MKNKINCEDCEDTGEVSFNEYDSDGNLERGVGTRKCDNPIHEPDDFSGASEGDR